VTRTPVAVTVGVSVGGMLVGVCVGVCVGVWSALAYAWPLACSSAYALVWR
jgi:ABC-type arginine transport system permease subunit